MADISTRQDPTTDAGPAEKSPETGSGTSEAKNGSVATPSEVTAKTDGPATTEPASEPSATAEPAAEPEPTEAKPEPAAEATGGAAPTASAETATAPAEPESSAGPAAEAEPAAQAESPNGTAVQAAKPAEAATPEPPISDAPKPDAPKPDAPKPDAPKPDAPKPDAKPAATTLADKMAADKMAADAGPGPIAAPDHPYSPPAVEPSLEAPPAPKPPRSRPSALVMALSVLLVLLVAAGVALFVHNHSASAANADKEAALQSAKEVATNLTTISSENAAAQIDALNKQAVGSFKDQIAGYAAMFQAVLKQGNVASTGTVTAAGVEKLEAGNATVLVTIAARISNGQVPQGQPRAYRLMISMLRDGDHWSASNVDFVP